MRLIAFIRAKNPDILCLSELNGWDRDNFAKLSYFKKRTGFAFSAFSKSRYGYHIALLSKRPLKDVLVLRKGLDYGVIITNVAANPKDYCVVLTHLSPINEDRRLEEMERILNAIRGKRRVILLGILTPYPHRTLPMTLRS